MSDAKFAVRIGDMGLRKRDLEFDWFAMADGANSFEQANGLTKRPTRCPCRPRERKIGDAEFLARFLARRCGLTVKRNGVLDGIGERVDKMKVLRLVGLLQQRELFCDRFSPFFSRHVGSISCHCFQSCSTLDLGTRKEILTHSATTSNGLKSRKVTSANHGLKRQSDARGGPSRS